MGRKRFLAAMVLASALCAGCATSPAPGRHETYLSRLEAQAAQGGAEQAFAVAEYHAERGDRRALRWYRRAARGKPVDHWATRAAYELGRIHATGRLSVDAEPSQRRTPDPRAGSRWMQRAAYQGSWLAMNWLSLDARNAGNADVEARWLLRSAMTNGNLFGLADARGALRGDAPRLERIVAQASAGAERGDGEALVDLGMLHHLGLGVAHDHAMAMSCFQRAASRRNVFGMHYAGLLIVRDYLPDTPREEAAPWFEAALRRGFFPAADWRSIRLEFPDFSS